STDQSRRRWYSGSRMAKRATRRRRSWSAIRGVVPLETPQADLGEWTKKTTQLVEAANAVFRAKTRQWSDSQRRAIAGAATTSIVESAKPRAHAQRNRIRHRYALAKEVRRQRGDGSPDNSLGGCDNVAFLEMCSGRLWSAVHPGARARSTADRHVEGQRQWPRGRVGHQERCGP